MKEILKSHFKRYPFMAPRDVLKLCFQSEFGPEHMIPDPGQAEAYILREWQTCGNEPRSPEDIGNGLARFHLTGEYAPEEAAPLLAKLFCLTAEHHKGTRQGLISRLEAARELPIPGIEEAIGEYISMGCPAVHHSPGFRQAYDPHYRLLRKDMALYFPALLELKSLGPAIVAVDGPCGSGKTGFADLVRRVLDCNLVHMDDFYLPMSGRQENWQQIPGGNMDFDRLRLQVLEPLSRGEAAEYRPYSCQTGEYGPGIGLQPGKLTLVEGSYSRHPALVGYYEKQFFLTCPEELRMDRLKNREGEYFAVFQRLWIPMEQRYFRQYPPETCSVLDTGFLG